MSDLLELAERCEKAEGPDTELDRAIAVALPRGDWWQDCVGPPGYEAKLFTASIDAALSLVPDGLAWAGEFSDYNYANCWPDTPDYDGRPLGEGRGTTAALALCAAALRARAV